MSIERGKLLNQKYLRELELWFRDKFILPRLPNTAAKLFGVLGLFIGIFSSVVIFFLSYHFGLYVAQNFAPDWSRLISIYFGITAVIPLAFLAGRTSYYVLQAMVMPSSAMETKIFATLYQKRKSNLNKLIWIIAILSATPFFYLTHTYLYPLIRWWVIPFDVAAILGPIFVNSWALSSASNNLFYLIYHIKSCCQQQALQPYERALLELHTRLSYIQYIISRLRTHEVEVIFQQVSAIDSQQNIKNLFNLATLQNKRFKQQIPYGQFIFAYTGAIIGAVSEYQYYGTGRDAALWLNATPAVACLIGLAALICNGTLMGYTSKIIFEEMYAWIDRQRFKLQKAEAIYAASPTLKAAKPFWEWLKIIIKKMFSDLSNFIVLIIAVSAATPNVYLTILQQKTAAWYNYIWLVIAFLGPFCTNFFAISRALHQSTYRHKIQNTLLSIKTVLPHFKPKYLISLKLLNR